MLRPAALALALTLGGTLSAPAFDMAAMTEDERQAFQAEIRAYLLANPEVIMEAVAALEAREAEIAAETDTQAVIANRSALEDADTSWIGGNPDGDVTIVEFIDYRCGFCRRAHPVLGDLLDKDDGIRLVVKELPILGDQSTLASRFALAVKLAHGDAAYKRVHDGLIEMRGPVTEATLVALAEGEGFDPAPLLAGMSAPEVNRVLVETRALAQTLGISGTPTFVVGDQLLRGFLPLDGMEAVVAEAREG